MQRKSYFFLVGGIVATILVWGIWVKYQYKIAAHVFKPKFILSVYSLFDRKSNLNNREVLEDLAIVSTSCDKRHELWGAQFPILLKYWPSLMGELQSLPIYLVSNFKNYGDPRIQTIAVGEDISWSDNLIKALDKIEKKYVLLLMDDYILNREVDEERLIQVLNLMKANHSAHTEIVSEWPWLYDGIDHKRVPWLVYRNQAGRYRTSLQAGIWDKEALKSLLKPKESAWKFEQTASQRSFFMFRPFYLIKGAPLMYYLNAADTKETEDPTKSVYKRTVLDHLDSSEGITIKPEMVKVSD